MPEPQRVRACVARSNTPIRGHVDAQSTVWRDGRRRDAQTAWPVWAWRYPNTHALLQRLPLAFALSPPPTDRSSPRRCFPQNPPRRPLYGPQCTLSTPRPFRLGRCRPSIPTRSACPWGATSPPPLSPLVPADSTLQASSRRILSSHSGRRAPDAKQQARVHSTALGTARTSSRQTASPVADTRPSWGQAPTAAPSHRSPPSPARPWPLPAIAPAP